MKKYEDIINYHYVMKHPRMTRGERSFQFAPFSALVGFNDLIKERERETTKQIEITDDIKDLLDYKLHLINCNINFHPEIKITYFIKDLYKDGGCYETVVGYIKKIDFYHQFVILESNQKINIKDIIDINSKDINLSDFFN